MACIRSGGGKRDSREDLQKRVIKFVGTSKGGSGPQMIDAATFLPVLLDRVENLDATPVKLGSDGASQHLKHVLGLLPQAVAERRERVQEWLAAILAWCNPEQLDAEDAVKIVLATIDRAQASSVRVTPFNAFQRLKRAGTRFVSRHPTSLWQEVAAGLRDLGSLAAKDRLSFLARQSEEALRDVTRFVDLSDQIIGDLEARIVEERKGNTDLPNRIESALEKLHREFEQTGAALEKVSKIDLGSSE